MKHEMNNSFGQMREPGADDLSCGALLARHQRKRPFAGHAVTRFGAQHII
jgi:hypothetical protein